MVVSETTKIGIERSDGSEFSSQGDAQVQKNIKDNPSLEPSPKTPSSKRTNGEGFRESLFNVGSQICNQDEGKTGKERVGDQSNVTSSNANKGSNGKDDTSPHGSRVKSPSDSVPRLRVSRSQEKVCGKLDVARLYVMKVNRDSNAA